MSDMSWKYKFWSWLAWKLPRQLVYFVGIRFIVNATWKHSDRIVSKISALEVLQAWEI